MKDLAAQLLGKKRWKGKTKKQRRAHALRMVEAKKSKATPTKI